MTSPFGDAIFLLGSSSLSVVLAIAAFRLIRASRGSGPTDSANPGWLRLLIGNTLVLCFLFSLILLGAEGYLRLFYDTTDVLNQTRVSRRWFDRYWQHNNGQVRDNIDYQMTRTGGRRRLTVVGDSFTAGQGVKDVEDRFVNIIRRERPDWEVHSIAKLGLDTRHEIIALGEITQLGYELDLVVLAYCWNDILPVIEELAPFFEAMNAPRAEAGAFWVDHSFAINWLYHRYRLYRQSQVLGDEWTGVFERAYAGPLWKKQAMWLSRFKDDVEAAGGRLAVVTFPRLYPLTQGEVGLSIMHDRLKALWSRLEVPYLDLLPVIRPHTGLQLVINSHDEHPSEFTHRLAAEAMLPFLDPMMAVQ